jgi:hypothetical protein
MIGDANQPICWEERVDVWRPGSSRPAQTLGVDDTLNGEDVGPGFAWSVKELFS